MHCLIATSWELGERAVSDGPQIGPIFSTQLIKLSDMALSRGPQQHLEDTSAFK